MINIGIDLIQQSSTWDIKIDGPERHQLEKHLINIEETEREKIFLTAAKILGNCPDPYLKKGKSTGLALGKVQSGKTGSFIALTSLAFDNAYRVVIILAGTKKNLLDQTQKRIKKQLIDYRTDRKIALLSTHEKIHKVQEQEIMAILESGNNVLITILKHHEHINRLSEIFSSPELKNYPTLIIDDEGDQASLNNKKKKGQSSTYREINQLKETFELGALVAFTATPQANLLIETLDNLSPEFCILIEPGKDYTGGSTFHGDKDTYIRNIPEDEIPFEDNIPKSFIQALSIYFVGAAIRSLRGDDGDHAMLVHTSGSKKDHQGVGSLIIHLVEKWKSVMDLPPIDPARTNLDGYLYQSYMDINKSGRNYAEWESVVKQISIEMKTLKTWIVNSSPDAEIPNERLNLKNNIFIGGNMLERGVTIEGLAITYITRRAKTSQSDTVEQRARWFGYKQHYKDVCRIFAPKNVAEGFANLLGDEDNLWLSMRQNDEEGVALKNWPRIIQCSSPFRPTRPSVVSVKKVQYEKWNYLKKVSLNSEVANKNVGIVKEWFDNKPSFNEEYGGTSHTVAFDIDLKILLRELVSQISLTLKDDDSFEIINTILKRLLYNDSSLKINVVLMREGTIRARKYQNGMIEQLMQGRNKKYPGDHHILSETFQLQLHIVQPQDENKKPMVESTLAMALFVPESLLENMGRLVKPNGK